MRGKKVIQTHVAIKIRITIIIVYVCLLGRTAIIITIFEYNYCALLYNITQARAVPCRTTTLRFIPTATVK